MIGESNIVSEELHILGAQAEVRYLSDKRWRAEGKNDVVIPNYVCTALGDTFSSVHYPFF